MGCELDLDDVVPQAVFSITKDSTQNLSCRLYAFVSNQAAIEQLLHLWDEWIRDPTQRARPGFGAFKNLFKHLRELRRWSAAARQALGRVAVILRGAGDTLQRQFGPAAVEILYEALDDAVREIDRSFGTPASGAGVEQSDTSEQPEPAAGG
jgi:hypothetical protein